MTEVWSIAQLKAHQAKKKAKYRSEKVLVDQITFHSKREARRWKKLRLMQQAGVIRALERQVPFELNEGGKFSYVYRADFVYIDVETGMLYVEDSKGCRTREYLKKRKLMKEIYKIEIKEV